MARCIGGRLVLAAASAILMGVAPGWAAGLASAPAPVPDLRTASMPPDAFRVRIAWEALSHSVGSALQGAAKRLQTPACSRIFGDFKDAGGRTLQANLDALELSGPSYLSQIGFYTGQGRVHCLNEGTFAITFPGSRAVWVCPQFAFKQRRDPGLAEAVLIHEALHSLGLRENPPSSAQITAAVVARCGR